MQYRDLQNQILLAVQNIMENAQFILGEDVELFEKEFAEFCETKFAVGVDSGTSALELALRSFGIGIGDEIITAANTFIASTLAISITGAIPVLVDIHPDTYTIDVNSIESSITEHTRAIMPIHLYGQPANMDPILEIAQAHQLSVIEDACQAHGAKYKGKKVGSLGDAAAFSFYPSKNLGAYGDAGMVVTNSENITRSLQLMRNYGQKEKYHHLIQGYNRRLDTIQAAILRIKLGYLKDWNDDRRHHAKLYHEQLRDAAVVLPVEPDYAKSVSHLYVIRSEKRNDLRAFLRKRGVETGIHYPVPIHLQQAYKDLGYKKGDFPVTERYADEVLSLPMYPTLTDVQIKFVCGAIKDFTRGLRRN